MPNSILKNAPLVEVVFEIKFKDPAAVNYDLLVGELHSKLKGRFPFVESLAPGVPVSMLPHRIIHRFRTERLKYPLYQIGPGIVSFNVDGPTYTEGWVGFRKDLMSFLRVYRNLLGDEFSNEKIERISLRYLDKIEDARMYPEVKRYFDENLKLKIDLDFANNQIFLNKLENTSLSQSYKVDEKFNLGFKIETIAEGSRKLLVDSYVYTDEMGDIDELKKWLDKSHAILKKFFLELTSNIKNLFD